MTRRTALALGTLSLGRGMLFAQSMRLAPNAASELVLEVKKTGLLAGKKHRFLFSQFEGTVTTQPSPAVTFAVQSGSLICQDDWVKPKDREKITRFAVDELLEAGKYPTLRYQSTAVQPTSGGYSITGNLTIKATTRAVTVEVLQSASGASAWTGQANIRLTDFGLTPPKAALGAIGTEDLMHFTFRLSAEAQA